MRFQNRRKTCPKSIGRENTCSTGRNFVPKCSVPGKILHVAQILLSDVIMELFTLLPLIGIRKGADEIFL